MVPYLDTWQAGFQRQLSQTMSVEARYVGARSGDSWRTTNYNELNIVENGFLDEFKLAMSNLQANNAAGGRGPYSFATSATAPARRRCRSCWRYFNGVNRSGAGNAAAYTSANFRAATYVDPLAKFNPNPYAIVTSLRDDAAARDRAVAAGWRGISSSPIPI